MNISICIATFRRPERLAILLDDLRHQQYLPDEVVIVDNDEAGTARAVVQRFSASKPPFAVVYDIQPQRNIAMTRNRTVALAHGDWLVFVDDDERAPGAWLQRLLESAVEYAADGVLGPVQPEVPVYAPAWIRRGRFYEFPRLQTGALVPLNRMRFGNVLLRATCLRGEREPFDVTFGLATGEDGDLLVRLARRGARIIWCDCASVSEPIEQQRLSLAWLLRRALCGGQEFARQSLKGGYGPIGAAGKTRLLVRATLQLALASGLALVCLPAGRHRSAAWLVRAAANMGKLTAFCGWRHRAYA